MDPKISKDDLRTLASAIREAGIDTIQGMLYADRTMKDADMYGEGWCWDDDNAMLSPLVYQRKDNMLRVMIDVMKEEGIVLLGQTGDKACPKGARTLYELTRPLVDVLRPMMKQSNNLYAESVYYQIGLSQGKPSTAKKAKAVEEVLLKKMGLGDAIHRFADGSGLSLYNYVSAEIEVAFLRYAYARKEIYDVLYDVLPIAAVDGTIDKRMAGTPAAGNVRAKTGTLSGVSSLSGYCTAPNGHVLCFAIMNQGVMRTAVAKAMQDKLCVAICSEN
jgi:D-alanyl-D-alanine carboxypeptidase/D-alanyl-D-alanine-endopeptidase (penicillin-binding protein 4)